MATLLYRSATFRSSEQLQNTLLTLNDQRNFSQFCDVILRVCGTQIFAHSNVLAAASPYFSSFLGVGPDCPRAFSQKQPQIIEIQIDNVLLNEGDGGYGEAVRRVVEYMYTNEIIITTNLFAQIIEISRIMLLDKLLSYCEDFQKGIDGNSPKDVSTCTSTLREVVEILGSHTKGFKCDAQTETEEVLFAKVNNVSNQDGNINHGSSKFDLLLNGRTNFSNSSVQDVKANNSSIVSSTHLQVTDSLAFRPTVCPDESGTAVTTVCSDKIGQESDLFDNLNRLDNKTITIEEKKDSADIEEPFTTESDQEENFNAIKSFDDILDCPSVSTEVPCDIISRVGEKKTANQPSSNEQPLVLNETKTVTEVELADISDLVTFSSLSSSNTGSVSTQKKPTYQKTGRPRGRPRKKKRGRPRGRREVDRSADYDVESDYEFEEFMNKLETGESVDTNNDNQNEQDQTMSGGTDISHLNSSNLHTQVKKSDRVRSRPSQLRNDYILHSLGRKTRKSRGSTLNIRSKNRMRVNADNKPAEESSQGLRFMCQKCDYNTVVFKSYVAHLSTHPDLKTYQCSDCNFKTTKARAFNKHKIQHLEDKLICLYCHYQASDATEFKEHSSKHSGDFPFFCTECDARFRKRSQLESHKPKHWIERPFICPVCKAGFKWKHSLKNHMVTHSTAKEHLCDICGYATAHKSMLTAHQLVHTGDTFKCLVEGCHFEATKRQKLKMHMLTHTREKPHQCEVCGQRFSLAKNMRRHTLLHTNTRPFACKICSFKTTRYDKLKEHNQKSHNIGGPPVTEKNTEEGFEVPIDSNMITTVVVTTTADKIKLEADGTISAESLQKIAELAAAQQSNNSCIQDEVSTNETIIKIEQPPADDHTTPIMAHIEFSQPDVGAGEPIERLILPDIE